MGAGAGRRKQKMKTNKSRWEPLTNELRATNLILFFIMVFGILYFMRIEYLLLKILLLLEN